MWILAPVVASLGVLGAHFYRAQAALPLAACAVLVGLLAVPRAWAARLVQAALVLGAVEWVRTLVVIAIHRAEAGLPWTRMAVILGVVALVTLASAAVFRHRRVGAYYGLRAPEG